MSTNKQALREAANGAEPEVWIGIEDDLNADGYSRAITRFIQHCSPATVLALLDELEAMKRANAVQADHINQQQDRIESLEKKNGELGRAYGAAEKRIAVLEAREVKLPDIKNYLSYVTEPTLDRALRLTANGVRSGDISAIRAAGITVKGDSE